MWGVKIQLLWIISLGKKNRGKWTSEVPPCSVQMLPPLGVPSEGLEAGSILFIWHAALAELFRMNYWQLWSSQSEVSRRQLINNWCLGEELISSDHPRVTGSPAPFPAQPDLCPDKAQPLQGGKQAGATYKKKIKKYGKDSPKHSCDTEFHAEDTEQVCLWTWDREGNVAVWFGGAGSHQRGSGAFPVAPMLLWWLKRSQWKIHLLDPHLAFHHDPQEEGAHRTQLIGALEFMSAQEVEFQSISVHFLLVFLQLRFFQCGCIFQVWHIICVRPEVGFNKSQPRQTQGATQPEKVLGRIRVHLLWKKAIQTCFPQDLRQTCCLTRLIPKVAEFPGNSMAETNHHFLFRKWKWRAIVPFFFLFLFYFWWEKQLLNSFTTFWGELQWSSANCDLSQRGGGDMMELELISHLQWALCKVAPVFPGPTNAQLLEEANN